jgi:hypothetical protein
MQSLATEPAERLGTAPGYRSEGHLSYRQMDRPDRPIVRLEVMNRMVTKGYQKGVYERVTKGITGGVTVRGHLSAGTGSNMNAVFGSGRPTVYFSEGGDCGNARN